MNRLKKTLATLCALSLLVCQLGTIAFAQGSGAGVNGVTPLDSETSALDRLIGEQQNRKYADAGSYDSYLAEHDSAPRPETEIVIPALSYSKDDGADVRTGAYAGKDNALLWDSQDGAVEWTFEVQQEGVYNLGFLYCPIAYKGNDIELTLLLDGAVPYSNAQLIALPRLWENETNDFKQDRKGNEIRPDQVELFQWNEYGVIDNDAQYNGHLSFYLSKGTHTVRLEILHSFLSGAGARQLYGYVGGLVGGRLHRQPGVFAKIRS